MWVKIGDFGLSKRVEDQLGLTNTLKGTFGFIAPELHGFIPRTDDYAPDMWALGEISFQMLTKKPTFRHLGILVQYVNDKSLFPENDLQEHKVSTWAVDFIRCAMATSPGDRLTADDGLVHAWIAAFAPENPTPELPTLQRRSTDRRRSAEVDEVAEDFGVWTAFSEAGEQSDPQTIRPDPQTVKAVSSPDVPRTSSTQDTASSASSPPPPVPSRKPVPEQATLLSVPKDLPRPSSAQPALAHQREESMNADLERRHDVSQEAVRRAENQVLAREGLSLGDRLRKITAEQEKERLPPAVNNKRSAVDEVFGLSSHEPATKSLGDARRESIQARRARREDEMASPVVHQLEPEPVKRDLKSWWKSFRTPKKTEASRMSIGGYAEEEQGMDRRVCHSNLR